MKNKLIIIALIAISLAVGMVIVSCGKCPGDGKCEWNTANDEPSESIMKSWCFFSNSSSDEELATNMVDCFGSGQTGTLKCGC